MYCERRLEDAVREIKEKADEDPKDRRLKWELRAAKGRLSNIQNEHGVEDVVQNFSLTTFQRKCPAMREARRFNPARRPPKNELLGDGLKNQY